MQSMEKSLSVCLLRADGLDQSKRRVPRTLAAKSHLHERLIRPALHIQMSHAVGHALMFAVLDADVFKSTSTNWETMA